MSRETLETERLQDLEHREQTLEDIMSRAENLLSRLESMVWAHLLEHEEEKGLG